MLPGVLERSLIALGRHATHFDAVYWAYVLLALAIGVSLSLVTGLWGFAGIALAAFAGIAIFARRRYEQSQDR
jgi:hypothetical protein